MRITRRCSDFRTIHFNMNISEVPWSRGPVVLWSPVFGAGKHDDQSRQIHSMTPAAPSLSPSAAPVP